MSISAARLEANRRNAQLSTGPRTPEGKARSSQNGCTHCLTAVALPVLARDRDRLKALAAELVSTYQPSGPIEEDCLSQMTTARWNMLQSDRILAGYWDLAETPELPEPKRMSERHRCRALAFALIDDCRGANIFPKVMRYQASSRRLFDRAYKALLNHRTEKCEANPTPEPPSLTDKPLETMAAVASSQLHDEIEDCPLMPLNPGFDPSSPTESPNPARLEPHPRNPRKS